jgi:hypothetical protein
MTENASSKINRNPEISVDCHKRWMEISKVSEFPTRVAELTRLFEPSKPRQVPPPAPQQEPEDIYPEIVTIDATTNTEISGNFKLHVAEVQSYLTEIATLRRTTTAQAREISDVRNAAAQEISDLREELRILGEVHADEKENFIAETSAALRDFRAEIKNLEDENRELKDERNHLVAELEKRMRQLTTAAEKYKKLKIGNENLQISDTQWQQKFYDMQSELEFQRENFRQQITDLYWETVNEYESVFTAELNKQQETFDIQKSILAKKHRDDFWKSILWSQALTVFLGIIFHLASIR